MNDFSHALTLDHLPVQGFRAVTLDGRSVLIGRANGRLFACLDRCPHAGAPLKIGKLRGDELECPRHGWIFNVLTGSSVPENPTIRLTQCPVRIDGTAVLVHLST